MPPTLIPQPAWLAVRMAPCGHELALSLIGAGLLCGALTNDPEAVQGFYSALATSTDPLHELRETYTAMGAHYDYLLDTVTPLLTWAENATSLVDATARRAAGVLADVDFIETAVMCGGDLLGQVRSELEIQRTRHRPVLEYLELETAIDAAMHDWQRLAEGNGMMDGWCYSGVRVMGMAQAMRLLDLDPDTCHWHMRDPDPVNLAVAAINLASMGLHDCTFEAAPGLFQGSFSQRLTTMEELEAGTEKMYIAEDMGAAVFVDEMVKATMLADMMNFEINNRADYAAVEDVLFAHHHGPDAYAAKEAMRNRKRRR